MSTVETHVFQAETKRLLDLMIHSLYSNKEIFLRELISNASDALDRLRFEALTKPELLGADPLEIRLETGKEPRTLTIHDNGIGMNREELIAHLGTIAKSGTRELVEKLDAAESKQQLAEMIGQFGVGFYSSFMVAERVVVVTRRAGDSQAWRWESTGDGTYALEEGAREKSGTSITLTLKPEDKENGLEDFAERWAIQRVVRRYSDFVSYPIVLNTEKDEDLDKKAMGEEVEVRMEDKVLNSRQPIWTRPQSEVTADEYNAFYRQVSHDWNEPLEVHSFKAEGRFEYQALLFIPSEAPYDLYYVASKPGLQLFVKRIQIMERCEDLLPQYLRFVRGVVDTNDLPLNVSREILQESKDIEAIRSGCTKKILGLLEDLAANDQEKFTKFWAEFGMVLKEGAGQDFANKDKIAGLLRFASTHADNDTQNVSLAEYIARMKDGQDKIYYITADTFNAAKNSPHLEVFRKKGIEVMLLSDRIDEWVVGSVTEFSGKSLVSVAKGGLDLGNLEDEAEKQEQEKQANDHKELTEKIKASLAERVKEVRVTHRLTDSPACLVADEHDLGANMMRMLKAAGQKAPTSKPILEINPTHPVVVRLKAEQKHFDDWTAVLFDQALLAEGGQLDDPAGFVKRVNHLMLEMSAG